MLLWEEYARGNPLAYTTAKTCPSSRLMCDLMSALICSELATLVT